MSSSTRKKVFVSLFGCLLALGAGGLVMFALSAYGKSRQEPGEERKEAVLRVEAAQVSPGDYPVSFVAYGQARAAREATIAPEVSGTIDFVRPNLEDGSAVREGEVLFRINQASFQAQREEAAAAVAQQEAAIARIHEEWAIEKTRLAAVESTLELTSNELERAKDLKTGGVGSQSAVELAERAVIEAKSQRDVAARGLDVYPLRLQEAEAMLRTANARLQLAELNLARSEIKAPFTGRVKDEHVEAGQFINAGSPAMRLADDRVLEIEAPIDSRTARDWLEFEGNPTSEGWFGTPVQAACTIHWTEDPERTAWEGAIDRIAAFDPESRMLRLVIRHDTSDGGGFPLADGMFCSVEIPGRMMRGVYRVPAAAVTYDSTVYLAVDDRLSSRSVEVLREADGYAYISAGLESGDIVVTTRLLDALDNTLLDARMIDLAAPEGADA